MSRRKHNLLLGRAFQYLGIILIVVTIGGGYWYWKQAHAGMNIGGNEKNLLTNGLVGYWPFDSPDIAGTTAYDRSGSGNNGTLVSGPTKTVGKVGQALSFNGTSQYVNLGNPSNLNITGVITLSAWVNFSSFPTADNGCSGYCGVIIEKGYANPIEAYYLRYAYTGGLPMLKVGSYNGTDYNTSWNIAFGLGSWHHVVGLYAGSSWKLYVDGINVATTQAGIGATSSTANASIGAAWIAGSPARYFPGAIDEPRIYNRALSDSEVQMLYQAGAGDKLNSADSQADSQIDPLQKGMVGYWELDDGSGTSAADASGNGNTGTLTNGPTWTTGKINGAVTFNSGATNGQYIDAGASVDDSITNAFALSAWISPEGLSGQREIMRNDAGNGNRGIDIRTNGAHAEVYTYNGAVRSVMGSITLSTSVWTHIVGTYDGTSLKLFVNGVQDGTLSTSGNVVLSSTSLFIGSGVYQGFLAGSQGEFRGKIDEVRVYNRALSADEVAKLYNTTVPGNHDGLVGYWSFNGPDIAGTTAYDRSGSGNNGTLVSGPTKTVGKVGQALSFNGTSQSVSLGTPGALALYTDYTISAWFNASTLPGNNGPIVSRTDGTYTTYVVTLNSTGTVTFAWWTGSTSEAVTTNTVAVANKWYHVVATVTGGKQYIYMNGVPDNNHTYGSTAQSASGITSYVGYRGDAGGYYFPGVIDEPRIYSRALSDSEVQMLYQAGAGDKFNSADSQVSPLDKGLVGYWKLDDGSGTSAADTSGNGNTGTLTNGPSWTTGKIIGATNFDGVNDYIDAGTGASLDVGGTKNLTISVWTKKTTGSDSGMVLVNKGQSSNGGYDLGIGVDGCSAHQLSISKPGRTWVCTGTFPQDTNWHHVVEVWSSTGGVVYVDGAVSGTSGDTAPFGSYSGSLKIGMQYDGTSNPFNGSLDEVRVYNRALSPDEVSKLYQTTAPDNPDTGLVGYWSFNGPDVAGTTAYDRSGKGGSGTLTNGPTVTEGKVSQALSFDGSNDYVSIADNATLNFGASADFALSGWFWRDTSTTVDTILAKRNGIANTDYGYIVYIANVDNKLHFEVSDNANNEFELVSNSAFTIPGWNHFVIVWDDNSTANTEIYINGVADGAAETGTQGNIGDLSNALTLRIGAESDNGNPFDGKLDEIRVYNRTLSATEIKGQYDQGGRIGWICGNGTVADADNNIYGTIQIGTQCWMRQNMRVGTRIAASTDQTNNATIEKYCDSNSDANCTSANPNQPDGGLYQWNEAMQYVTTAGARGICPTGFHIPTDAEQYTLENYLKDVGQTCDASRNGGYDCNTAGTKLRPGGTSGFEGNLAGYASAGHFVNRGSVGWFWSSSESGSNNSAWFRNLRFPMSAVYREAYSKTSFAFSVRCVAD